MISGVDHEKWKWEISIVSFKEVSSLPLDFVRRIATGKELRPRMRSPYREHIAQAFARYFMRVGLPVDIPSFKSTKSEAEVMKKLEAMDSEMRKHILNCFQ